ncbi:putative tRNA pseudouridine synthase-like 1 [Apostichopus japonicus]|uniref:tRNA pseudouridine synthase n=1 Tax=Stichopus japonicus TaxID=307972 RepID=A0A2G8JC39_STIJA|nr:putative tRNA pseudouridine synthase-like 1 [Apostichopus japonicus]
MLKVRYLIFFQYIGTNYSGLARNGSKDSSKQGVLDILQEAIQKLTPIQIQNLTSSCQTDAGVHALTNTVHVDVERRPHQRPFHPDTLVKSINNRLRSTDIRIIRAHRVPDTFHARHCAIRRDYLYRLALGCPSEDQMPVVERDRCFGIQEFDLDIAKMQEAAGLFIGLKDFATFRNLRHDFKDLYTEREMYSVSIYHPANHHGSLLWHPYDYRILHIEFSARSYLYRQIRRLVGVLIDVGRGRLTPEDVDAMLQSRDNTNMRGTRPAPASGLYLKDVIYDEKDLCVEETKRIEVEEVGLDR